MKNTHNTQSNNSLIQLSNGKSVPPEILELVGLVVEDRIPSLSPAATYELQQICSDYFWDLFDDGERRRAGWCMVHLVEKGALPMISVNECKHQSPKKYRLK